MGSDYQYAGNLAGYAVLVTGGGTGIGKGCAMALAADGAAVIITGRRKDVLEAAAVDIEAAAAHGGSVSVVVGDVTDEEAVKKLVASAVETSGRLDACIANAAAGVRMIHDGSAHDS